jgi:hypothetical protein
MQAAEHPALGALREALLDKGLEAVTTEGGRDGGEPTPVLVRGVERRLAIATDPNPEEGRPRGLYGNRFARAPADAIVRATTVLDPPTITNLIAIAAPAGGRGAYERADIEYVLTTAYTAFAAARVESREAVGEAGRSAAAAAADGVRTVVHTGFWGCGAFGGNRVLMALLQVLAARMAGLDRLVFHTFDGPGSAALADAQDILSGEVGDAAAGEKWVTSEVLDRIEALGFAWGVSDGN